MNINQSQWFVDLACLPPLSPDDRDLWYADDLQVWRVNKRSPLCNTVTPNRGFASGMFFFSFHFFSPSLDSFIFPLSLLSPPLFHSEGGGNLCVCVCACCVAFVMRSHGEVLSANFTTCVKLKAVMWKRRLPSFLWCYCSVSPFPFLPTSTPFLFLSTSLIPLAPHPHPLLLSLTSPLYQPPIKVCRRSQRVKGF